MKTRLCKSCQVEKPYNEMVCKGTLKTGEPKLRNLCKKCDNKRREDARKVNQTETRRLSNLRRSRKFSANNKDRIRDNYLRNRYGIGLEYYNMMLEKQGSRCAICSNDEDKLFVDHCHKSGKVRGLLCSKCNSAIGFFEDNTEFLRNGISYIMKGGVL